MVLEFTPRTTTPGVDSTSTFLSKLQAAPLSRLNAVTPINQHTSGQTAGSTMPIAGPVIPQVTAAPENYSDSMTKLQSILGNQQDLTQSTLQQAAAAKLQAQLQAQAAAQAKAATEMPYQLGAPKGHVSELPYNGPTGPHQVQQWIDRALEILHLGNRFEPGIANIIMHESSGNPNSVNNWDSNAKAGHPSQGLMQTIPGTFQEYALPGYNHNILDPVSNIIAGVRYAMSRYGKGMLLEGGRHDSSGAYEGY